MLVNGYRCMRRARLELGGLSVEAVNPGHIESIRKWRNEQMAILRQSSEISPEQQQSYFNREIWPDQNVDRPRNILLACQEDGILIGYGGLVHIAWEHLRAEISFLLGTDHVRDTARYKRYFTSFLELFKTLAFDDLGLNRLFTETYAIRDHHIEALERAGFVLEGRMKHHVIIDSEPVDSLIHGCVNFKNRGKDEG